MADIIDIGGKFSQPGLYRLKDLPQRESVSRTALESGWWELDQIYRIYPGQFTVITGVPGSGKSTFVLNLICNLAKQHGLRPFLYVPENEGYIQEKMRRIWGDVPGFDSFASECWIQSAAQDAVDAPAQDIRWVLGRAIHTIELARVDVLLIDPWNELEWARAKDETLAEYITNCLKYLKYFCRIYNVAVIVVAHPTKQRAAGGGPVTLRDIEGSVAWWNKCDNGLIVERDDETKTTTIKSAKVREKGAGRLGSCYFTVDLDTEIFTPMYGAVT